jgi:hypothetical protein
VHRPSGKPIPPLVFQAQMVQNSLLASDIGKKHSAILTPLNWTMDLCSSKACRDWKTSLDFDTFAFIKIKNAFAQDITWVKLRYCVNRINPAWVELDYGFIAKGQLSNDLNMIETADVL